MGQSVTVPGSGTYNNLRFNWYHHNPTGAPVAFGRLYLLTQEYTGLASNLTPQGAAAQQDHRPAAAGWLTPTEKLRIVST